MATQGQAEGQGRAVEVSELDQLLQKEFKPRSDAAKEAVEAAVRTLAEQALQGTAVISKDAVATIESIIAALDRKLSEQINAIMHHKDFQEVEGAWRGLQYLVTNTETDEKLKIRVMNISKTDLGRTLKRYKGTAWDQSPIFKKVYEAEYGQFGGEPFGCLVGDYYFDHTPPDVELLGGMAQVGAAVPLPVHRRGIALGHADGELAGAGQPPRPDQDLHHPGVRPVALPARGGGLALHRARHAAVPRALPLRQGQSGGRVRLPGGHRGRPARQVHLGQLGLRHGRQHHPVVQALRLVLPHPRGGVGGAVEGLPVHTFPTDDGGVDMKCPTEIAISDRREAELAKNGFMPLLHRKNTDVAAFIGAQSLQKPFEYTDPDATANANLSARLPYLFAANRFAHYLKCIVRDKIGSFRERKDMEQWLNTWIKRYVLSNPESAGEETKAQYPLAAAEVQVEEVEGNPGYYRSRFYLRPHYQLEGLTVSLRLVSKLPSVKGAG